MKPIPKIFLFIIITLTPPRWDASESENMKRGEPGYLLAAPKTLTSGQNETFCISIHDASLPARVMLDLKIKDKHHVTSHMLNTRQECFDIPVPKLKHHIREAQFASLHLQIQLNGTVYSGHTQDPLLIYPNHNVIFIETDKGFYKPHEKVKIRILVLTPELKSPDKYVIPLIKIINPSGITVSVWENIPTELGLVQLEHQLAQDTSMGKWRIEVKDITKIFQVKEHVLPRFRVFFDNPKTIYSNHSITKFTLCGKYSYGENVKGIALIRINFGETRQPINKAKELKNGCAKMEFKSEESRFNEHINKEVYITATITEHGSSRVETITRKSHITNQPYLLKFVEEYNYFQPGLPYQGKLKATDIHIPLHKEVIQICYNVAIEKVWNIKNINQCSNFKFARDNTIYFYILPVKENVIQIRLYAKSLNQTTNRSPTLGGSNTNKITTEPTAYFTINRWYSPTGNYIQLEKTNKLYSTCTTSQHFTIHYTTGRLRQNGNITFYYVIKSRNKFIKFRSFTHTSHRQHLINYNELQNVVGKTHNYTKKEAFADKCVLKFKLDPKILAKYQLMVYYVLTNGEIIASNLDVSIEKCLQNKVKANWSSNVYSPGEKAILTINTAPKSLCAISAIDKSILFYENSKPLNIHTLVKPFLIERPTKRSNKLNCLPHAKKKTLQTTRSPSWDLKTRRKRHYGMTLSNQFDTYESFNNFGASVVTNMKLITKPCLQDGNLLISEPYIEFDDADTGVQFLTTRPKEIYYDIHADDQGSYIRSFFPETWLWELVPVGGHETRIPRDLPHTITNWITNTLCVSPDFGVGLSSQSEITVFQPFFLEVVTPASIKRNEILYLDVIVFNYLNHSIPIRVILGSSEGIYFPDYPGEMSETHCVFSQNSKTVTFRLAASQLGKIIINVFAEVEPSYADECGPEIIFNKRDMVIKEVLVQPEGHPVDVIKSILLCTKDSFDSSNSKNVSWRLELPNDLIEDSAKANIIVNADLLGPTINNLEKLLIVPTGCGEQLMATLAPNLYILKYLKAIKKLTPAMQQRARRNLKIGYQRILDYVHDDGSFSAFGYHDRSGSMFLTAFVIRILEESKTYIYVDQNVINNAVRWILNNQLENGCFSAVSHVFHDMGGTSTENSTAALTSYVLISLIEVGIELSEKVKTNAKYCIRGQVSPDKYTLAISTYALSLVGWESEASRSLHRLLQVSTTQDNLMWWSTPGSLSTNIEMTSYVLLSLLHQNSKSNLVHANSIVRWLASQRGPNGAFVTTQDTVIALNAITKYALLIHNREANLRVNISTNKEQYEMTINARESLKTKQHIVKELPSDVNITVEGEGCVLVQAHLRYNLNHVTNSAAFKLAVDVDSVSNTDQCSIAMVSPCLSYTGLALHSNMAILEVTMPSGYEPDRASLFKLVEENYSKVKRFEENENQVVLYFTELDNEPICVPFSINENSKIEARVDAFVKLYDYYNPEWNVMRKYKVNTCSPNKIAPIPPLPGHKNVTNNVEDTVPIVNQFSIEASGDLIINKKEDLINNNNNENDGSLEDENYGLNPSFVNLDINMSVPDGPEENIPTYIKPNNSLIDS